MKYWPLGAYIIPNFLTSGIQFSLSMKAPLQGNFWLLLKWSAGILLFLLFYFVIDLEPDEPLISRMMAVALLMAAWWVTEVVPLAVTALIPVVLFPALGIMDGRDVSETYFNYVIFLFIGGFLVALAMEKWELHKRIALRILMITGKGPGRILLGFMLATAFLSMWISNTAAMMMMIPILMSVISQLESTVGKEGLGKYALGLLLGTAYSASIGGIATLVGTPPNQAFVKIFDIMYPQAPEVSFTTWLLFALPLSAVFFTIIYFYIRAIFKPAIRTFRLTGEVSFSQQYKRLGPMSPEEKIVLADFILLAVLWLFRADLVFGQFIIPGWSGLFENPGYINDGTVAIAASVILFFIPSRDGSRILTWKTTVKLPWNIVLLFGGGFALASGFKESGLSEWIGNQMLFLQGLHPVIIIFAISMMMVFLTELTSNTATTQMILPIMAGLASSMGIHPLLFMLPVTVAASMAFMLPVATPPNAIIFGTNRVRVSEMARAGLVLNLIGAVLLTLATYYFAGKIFGFAMNEVPWWSGP